MVRGGLRYGGCGRSYQGGQRGQYGYSHRECFVPGHTVHSYGAQKI
ncbi:unnamed protein product [Linum tenue]|uniref:Uncharacterized protein n=1 Tax=Linum tenue TaxID=586396 RepID=A0AAV0QKA1_9ROSI|nr:unnamed protein product [Linum tenue]